MTRAPCERFLLTEPWGYFNLGYRRLHIVAAASASWIAELEAMLIMLFRPDSRCKNGNPGGENCRSNGLGRFLYVAESPKGLGNERRSSLVTSRWRTSKEVYRNPWESVEIYENLGKSKEGLEIKGDLWKRLGV